MTGYIVIYRDKELGIKLTMSNDCKAFTLIEYKLNRAKVVSIEELASLIKTLNITTISLEKLKQVNPLLGKNLDKDYGDNNDYKRKNKESLYRAPKNS